MGSSEAKRLHIVWFHLFDILQKENLSEQGRDQWVSGVGRSQRSNGGIRASKGEQTAAYV